MSKLFLAVAVALISCSKGGDDGDRNVSEMEQLLTSKEWVVQSLKHSTGSSDGWPGIGNEVCNGDDRYIFKAQGAKFEFRGGAEKCSGSEPEVLRSGSWTFLNIGQQLKLIGGGEVVFDVLGLSSGSMDLRTKVGDDVLDYTFVHP